MRKDINTVLVLGSGALKIGEAGEFDYSGSQALKALKEEGVRTILINPNIATVQTSEEIADKVYFLPVTPEFVERVIEKEKPDGVFVTFGGQTALNCGVDLYERGIFEKHNVEVLGTPIQSIMDSEDRDVFAKILRRIGVSTAKSIAVNTLEEAKEAAEKIGFPIICRSAYALGGLGSGFAYNMDELVALASKTLKIVPQILVEESLKGWKEVEYEVVRDQYDNCITVCNMENFDPIGIHTGESIVVAPSQTLSNQEYHKLRAVGIKVIRELGIIGECNIQYALDPKSEEYRVIEVNARLSRSSALASKATGYPLAFVAAKLGLGYGLFELKNSVTKDTSAFFEPALDYVVVKIPRWDLNKFYGVSREIGSAMKSVGEVMAIGKTFEEAIQKGIRMLDVGMRGFVAHKFKIDEKNIEEQLEKPDDNRLFVISKAFEQGYTVDQIFNHTKIDHWFLERLKNIYDTSVLFKNGKEDLGIIKTAKIQGFTDKQIASLLFGSENLNAKTLEIRAKRKAAGIIPYVKQIDTLAAEYPAQTNYLYMTYLADSHDIELNNGSNAVVVLGGGVYRIGSSVEFDWCSVNTLFEINKQGYESVMINYNPETVSTDYDMCNRLYFEELIFERVLDILEFENPKGVVLSMGGQIPNNLATRLDAQNVPILGTSPTKIDEAENRHIFSSNLDDLGIDQPRWKELSSREAIHIFKEDVGFPLLIRPSYVLSGAAMKVVYNDDELERFLTEAVNISPDHPVVVSEFILGAKELELDAVAQNGEIKAFAISEHVEFAGVHSGDATMYFPPQKVYIETIKQIQQVAKKIAAKYEISGPFNMQFLSKDNKVKVIELNLRASRSFPFVSKVMNNNLITKAAQVLLGDDVAVDPPAWMFGLDHVGVKASQFSFTRLQGADPVLSVDMTSTGEVGCIGNTAEEAMLKSLLSVGMKIPKKNILLSSGGIKQKVDLLEAAQLLVKNGYTIYATGGTNRFLEENGVESKKVHWPNSDKSPNVMDVIRNKEVELVINIPKNLTKKELDNDYLIRRAAVDFGIPLFTNSRLASTFIKAFCNLTTEDLEIKSLGEYIG